MNREAIKEIVRIKMDELAPEDQVASHPISKHIEQEMDEAALFILEGAPLHLLDYTAIEYSGNAVFDSDGKVYYIKVPADFLRLAHFKFADWERPVHSFVAQESNEYSLQLNPYTQAGKSKPVVAQVFAKPPGESTFGKWLMCAKVETEDLTPQLNYIKSCKPEALPDKLVEGLAWLTAGRLFQVFGMGDKAQAANQKYIEFIASKK